MSLTDREQRGIVIAATCKLKRRGDAWLVPSQSGSGKYEVEPDDDRPRCTCPDFETRGEPCKHIFAVRFTLRRERTDENGNTVTETVEITKTVTKTYPQNWRAYNAAQTHEKHHFQSLLHDLCRGVADPAPAPTGRPRLPLADTIFAVTFKTYSTVSGRRFACDLKDAHERGYLSRVPHYNSIFRYLEDERLTPILKAMVHKASLPLASVETHFSADSSGFSTSRFIRWYDHKYGGERKHKEWVKCHIMCGVKTNVVTAVEIEGKNQNDCPMLPPLLATTAQGFKVSEVSADMGYLSRENMMVAEQYGATPLIPFKSNSVCKEDEPQIWEKMFHFFQFNREQFLARYHQRSNVESTFSMVKAKFRDHIRSKTDVAMKNEALCKFLCHNICCLIQAMYEFGITPSFGAEPTVAPKLAVSTGF